VTGQAPTPGLFSLPDGRQVASDIVARSVNKFIYIRASGQILQIYPPLNKPKTFLPFHGLNPMHFGRIFSVCD
jgi:hypothetical protein